MLHLANANLQLSSSCRLFPRLKANYQYASQSHGMGLRYNWKNIDASCPARNSDLHVLFSQMNRYHEFPKYMMTLSKAILVIKTFMLSLSMPRQVDTCMYAAIVMAACSSPPHSVPMACRMKTFQSPPPVRCQLQAHVAGCRIHRISARPICSPSEKGGI